MESASQVLSYKGDPALGYGTAGTDATAAPIGVLDLNKSTGFDTVAHYTMLKKKDLYDLQKKEQDDAFNQLSKIDLSTDKILDNDREVIINNDINPIIDYLTKHPYALSPKTLQQVQENFEVNKLIDQFNVDRAKAQTRYILKPQVDKSIADDPYDREEKQKHYDKYFSTPLEYIVPYQKLYQYDWTKLGGDVEKKSVENDKSGLLKTTDELSSNLNTIINNAYRKMNEGDKPFNAYLTQHYNSYQEIYDGVDTEKQKLVDSLTTATPEQQAVINEQIKKIQPPLSREINSANNYITQYNAIHPDRPLPLFDATKPLNKTQYATLQAITANVKQPLTEHKESASDFYAMNERYRLAQQRINSKSGASATTQDYLISAVSPFIKQADSKFDLYDAGINGEKGYQVYTQKDIDGKDVIYNKHEYPDLNIVKTPDGKILAKTPEGELIEYVGKTWQKVDPPPIAIDNRIAKNLGGPVQSTQLHGKNLKITFVDEKGKSDDEGNKPLKTVVMDRVSYLRDLARDNKDYSATMEELEAYGIYDLNNDEQFAQAVELATTGKIDGKVPVKGAKTESVAEKMRRAAQKK